MSTLAAGLSGALLKDRLDAKRDRGQRRRDAYAGLMLALDELARVVSAPTTVSAGLRTGTVDQAVATTVGAVQRSYFAVYLTGSSRVQPAAEKAWQAAWNIHDWFITHPDPSSGLGELVDLGVKLKDVAEAFAEAVRKETAG